MINSIQISPTEKISVVSNNGQIGILVSIFGATVLKREISQDCAAALIFALEQGLEELETQKIRAGA